jgi:hypothetical protein
METPQKANLLRRLPFLHSLDDVSLLKIAERLTTASFPPQDPVFVEGDPADGLWIVEQGKVDLLRQEGEAWVSFGQQTTGDMLGDTDVLRGGPIGYTAVAAEATRLLLWRRDLLLDVLQEYPQVRREFEFMVAGRRLAQQLRLPWLADGEAVHAAARRHPAVLWRAWLLALLFLLPGAALLALGLAGWSLGLAPGIACLVVGTAIAVYQGIDWRNDYYLVTNRRAIWVEKTVLLYDSRQEAPLFNVLAVNLRTTVVGRLLGYGDVIIRTYTGQLTFREVAQPLVMGALIQEHWSRQRTSRQAADRDALTRSLQEAMTQGTQSSTQPAAPQHLTAGSNTGQPGLNRWDLRVRFEEDGVITYRKHWGVLIRSARWPSAFLALSVGFLALAGSGSFPALRMSTAVILGLAALLLSAGWWFYQFADWANDLYQVTSSQIIDVRKRPLGDEQRKVAPLENILGTEVERRGLVQLALNFGNVIANVGTSQFVFEGVFDPAGVQQDIVRAQEALLQRLRETEAGQRRDEMVELLHLYHERSTPSPDAPPAEPSN